jgi:hypothetical protein
VNDLLLKSIVPTFPVADVDVTYNELDPLTKSAVEVVIELLIFWLFLELSFRLPSNLYHPNKSSSCPGYPEYECNNGVDFCL